MSASKRTDELGSAVNTPFEEAVREAIHTSICKAKEQVEKQTPYRNWTAPQRAGLFTTMVRSALHLIGHEIVSGRLKATLEELRAAQNKLCNKNSWRDIGEFVEPGTRWQQYNKSVPSYRYITKQIIPQQMENPVNNETIKTLISHPPVENEAPALTMLKSELTEMENCLTAMWRETNKTEEINRDAARVAAGLSRMAETLQGA